MSIQISDKHTVVLRFPIGTRVECRTFVHSNGSHGWTPGTVVKHFYEQKSFPSGMCVPYQVKLDNGKLNYAPIDADHLIRFHASRLSARLASMPHEALAELAASLCDMDVTPSVRRSLVEKVIAARSPLPDWAVNEVLHSSDLLPSIFASLQLEDSAAAAACSSWRQAWQDTSNSRRGLRIAPTQLLVPAAQIGLVLMTAHPDGNWICASVFDEDPKTVCILDTKCGRNALYKLLHKLPTQYRNDMFAICSRETLYVSYEGARPLDSYDAETFAITAAFEPALDDDRFGGLAELALSANGILYALSFCKSGGSVEDNDSLFSFDACTLEKRSSIKLHWFKGQAYGLAVVEREICIGDKEGKCLHMLSLAGEPLRQLRGGWRQPDMIHHCNGRLYLLEQEEEQMDDDGVEKADYEYNAGKRIFVLTPSGETLKVWHTPHTPSGQDDIERILLLKETLIVRKLDGSLITLMGI